MSDGPDKQTRSRLDRARQHGFVTEWSEHADDSFRNGLYWLVEFPTGPPWKMSRNMVGAFDKALRVSRAYDADTLDENDVHALVAFVDAEGRGTNEPDALIVAVDHLRRLPGGRYVDEPVHS